VARAPSRYPLWFHEMTKHDPADIVERTALACLIASVVVLGVGAVAGLGPREMIAPFVGAFTAQLVAIGVHVWRRLIEESES
jgi:hypothetical protein